MLLQTLLDCVDPVESRKTHATRDGIGNLCCIALRARFEARPVSRVFRVLGESYVSAEAFYELLCGDTSGDRPQFGCDTAKAAP
jgi:hypothetical protein